MFGKCMVDNNKPRNAGKWGPRDWRDWQWNDRQSQSFCLSFKVIFPSKPLILDVIVIVIGNFVIVNHV